jgi:hypothetical protein
MVGQNTKSMFTMIPSLGNGDKKFLNVLMVFLFLLKFIMRIITAGSSEEMKNAIILFFC